RGMVHRGDCAKADQVLDQTGEGCKVSHAPSMCCYGKGCGQRGLYEPCVQRFYMNKNPLLRRIVIMAYFFLCPLVLSG
ncbi:hypothetical protein ACET43_33350, partial [Pseudomonas aeruginosa]|uniref:hypothetical protein n=1 Tax=Pseudomonas aeruginosa TaxID=287 RepID=UPI0036E8178E